MDRGLVRPGARVRWAWRKARSGPRPSTWAAAGAASAAAFLNFGGNAGGFLAPTLTPWIGQVLNWGAAVAVGGLICLVGVVLWVWIDPRERLRIDI